MISFYDDLYSYKNNLAIIDKNRSYTYSELIDLIDGFPIDRLNKKSLVFILCDNNVESIIGYLGCLRNNSVPFLINSNICIDLLDKLLEVYKPDYVWTSSNRDIKGNKLFELNNYFLYDYMNIDSNIHKDLKLLLTTSGTTGSSKLVRLSKLNIESNANAIAHYLNLTERERPITTLPMSYTYGLSVINSHLAVGATILLTDELLMTRAFWDFFKQNKATSMAGVPFSYELLNKLKFASMDLPSLKTITQAGGKLPNYLIDTYTYYALRKNVDFYIMYGQTEATARISYLCVNDNPEKNKSIGRAIPGGSLNIIDENDNLITEINREGELIYSGPNVMMGYAENRSDLEKGDESNFVLKTGDLAKYDDEGYFYITGRKKRFIKIRGIRTNLDEIEEFLQSNGYNCAVDGIDENRIIVALTQDISEDMLFKINDLLVGMFRLHNVMIQKILVDKIHRGENGKILYNEIFKGLK